MNIKYNLIVALMAATVLALAFLIFGSVEPKRSELEIRTYKDTTCFYFKGSMDCEKYE